MKRFVVAALLATSSTLRLPQINSVLLTSTMAMSMLHYNGIKILLI